MHCNGLLHPDALTTSV